jgi:hypothetical protein
MNMRAFGNYLKRQTNYGKAKMHGLLSVKLTKKGNFGAVEYQIRRFRTVRSKNWLSSSINF